MGVAADEDDGVIAAHLVERRRGPRLRPGRGAVSPALDHAGPVGRPQLGDALAHQLDDVARPRGERRVEPHLLQRPLVEVDVLVPQARYAEAAAGVEHVDASARATRQAWADLADHPVDHQDVNRLDRLASRQRRPPAGGPVEADRAHVVDQEGGRAHAATLPGAPGRSEVGVHDAASGALSTVLLAGAGLGLQHETGAATADGGWSSRRGLPAKTPLRRHSTVTDLARLRGLSMSWPSARAAW